MSHSPLDPHAASAAELQKRLGAERAGVAFLVYRDGADEQQLLSLTPERERLTVGRASASDLWLSWDSEVSRVHAELERMGDDWTLLDDGLSANGTYLNGERLRGRRRLCDGDELRFGRTLVVFRTPPGTESGVTQLATDQLQVRLSDTQRQVLVALCRPFADGASFATPPTNQQIASEVFLSVDAVKSHLRALFGKFAVEDLPQNQKRAKLVELAFQQGVVSERDLS
jgi:pSer/pThr/pTyr-binding forkhead associated (FHA) protein